MMISSTGSFLRKASAAAIPAAPATIVQADVRGPAPANRIPAAKAIAIQAAGLLFTGEAHSRNYSRHRLRWQVDISYCGTDFSLHARVGRSGWVGSATICYMLRERASRNHNVILHIPVPAAQRYHMAHIAYAVAASVKAQAGTLCSTEFVRYHP
jgi:hypothetical protein